MLPNLLTCRWCPGGGLSHGQTACEPASRGGGGVAGNNWYNAIVVLEDILQTK